FERERLDRDADLDRPPAARALRRRFPDAVPVRVLVLAARLDERVVARAARVDREHIPRSAVEERTEHEPHVILGREHRLARFAEADDPRRIVVLALDAD